MSSTSSTLLSLPPGAGAESPLEPAPVPPWPPPIMPLPGPPVVGDTKSETGNATRCATAATNISTQMMNSCSPLLTSLMS